MVQRRVVGIVLSLTAIITILVPAVSRTWWTSTADGGSTSVGLRDVEQCAPARRLGTDGSFDSMMEDDVRPGPRCTTRSLRDWFRAEARADAPRRYYDYDQYEPRAALPGAFIVLGTLAFVAALASVAVLGAAVAAAAWAPAAAGPRILGGVAAFACGVLGAAALGFVIAAPKLLGTLRADVGPVLALTGAVLGAAGGLVIRRIDVRAEPRAAALHAASAASRTRRRLGLAIGGAGIALVVGSLATESWFRGSPGGWAHVRVGLRSLEVCETPRHDVVDDQLRSVEPGCDTRTIPANPGHSAQPRRMKAFLAAGTFGWSGGIATAIVVGLAALLAALAQPVRLGRLAVIAGGAFACCAIVYVVTRPRELAETTIGAGPFLALTGAAAVIASGVLLERWAAAVRRAIAATELAAAEPAPAVESAPEPPVDGAPVIPACPACGTPMLWVGARQAWLCTICKTTG